MCKELVRLENLKKYYAVKKGLPGQKKRFVKAVDDLSLEVYEGEVLGIVGESGCGKSTTGKLIARLLEPSEGKIIFQGKDISTFTRKEMRSIRKDMQVVFQDPYASLNPRMTVGEIIAEPLVVHGLTKTKEELNNRVAELCGWSAWIRTIPYDIPMNSAEDSGNESGSPELWRWNLN